MTENIDPIRILNTARGKLIDERRSLAVAIALGHRRRRTDDPQINEMRETFVDLQITIEAIDRAIVDERQIVTKSDYAAATFAEPSLAETNNLRDPPDIEAFAAKGSQVQGAS